MQDSAAQLRQWEERKLRNRQRTLARPATIPAEYRIKDASRRAVNFIRSTAKTHHARSGIRKVSAA